MCLSSFTFSPLHSFFFLSILICTRFIPHGTGKDPDKTQTESVEASQTSWLNKRTISLAMIALCLAFVEGSANDWIPLAMVDGYQVSHSMSTVIYALFLCGMISGRLLSGRFIDRFGRVLLLRVAILSAAAGLFLVILKISLVVCMISIFLWGLGASLGFPLTISAAGDDSRYAVKRVSIVTLSGYTASLSGPPVLGLLANQVGLLHAFIFVLFAICIAGIFTKAVAKPTSIHSFLKSARSLILVLFLNLINKIETFHEVKQSYRCLDVYRFFKEGK
ncbi:MFS transporter [Bacillus altitudinis]|uniref:MFS transporter n=1 Tax=Bacillus altitudinis TaxID=293387 RepID=UPI0032C4167B